MIHDSWEEPVENRTVRVIKPVVTVINTQLPACISNLHWQLPDDTMKCGANKRLTDQ